MIRLLTEEDRADVLTYLYQEPSYNIYPIGDIEAFGFDTDFQRVYAEIEEGQYKSILLRYKRNAIYYAHTLRFNEQYLKIFKQDPFTFISGDTRLLDLIAPYLKGFKKHRTYFCEAKKMKDLPVPHVEIKRMSTKEEVAKIFDLISTVEEFAMFIQDKETFIDAKMKSIK